VKTTISKLIKNEPTFAIACIVALLGFLIVTIFRANFHSVDVAVNVWIPSIQSSALTFFAQIIALIFDTISLVIISLVISGVLFLKNYKAHGLQLLGAMGGDAVIVSALKTLEHISRPTNAISFDSGFSYPSGHSAGCIVFGGILAYFAWQHWQSKSSRIAIGVSLGLIAGVVGFDRIYLNVHWLSDVFGGWLLGAFWLLFAILIFRQLNMTGKFQSDKFNQVANVLFGLAVVASVLIVVWVLFGFS
jgi:membrane-associated phospholipid phosphatase